MNDKFSNEKKLYAIFDNSTDRIYPDTHLFALNSDVKAVYSMIVFAGKLNDTDISVKCVGVMSDDGIIKPFDEPVCLCSFDNAIEYVKTYDENSMISAGFTHKTFLHHYNIIISNINNFRRSLIKDDEERGAKDE